MQTFIVLEKIPALDTVWCVGDIFLDFESDLLMANKNVGAWYLNTRCDVKYFTYPVMELNNFLIRVQMSLAIALNESGHLSRFIVLVLGDDFEKMTASYKLTELCFRWLISEIVVCVHRRKSYLPKKVVRSTEPKFVTVKPHPRCGILDISQAHKIKRRIFNRSIEAVVKKYDNFYMVNTDTIRPDTLEYFDANKKKSYLMLAMSNVGKQSVIWLNRLTKES